MTKIFRRKLSPIAIGVASLFAASCTTPAGRNPAQSSASINEKQLEMISQAGVGMLRLSIVSNGVAVESGLQKELQENLERITAGLRVSILTAGALGVAAGASSIFFGNLSTSFDLLHQSLVSFNGPVPQTFSHGAALARGGKVLFFTGVAVGALAVSGAFDSFSLSARTEIKQKAAEDLEKSKTVTLEQMTELADFYARVFSLEPGENIRLRNLVLKEVYRLSVKTKLSGEADFKDIEISIPELMVRENLISKVSFEEFNRHLAVLEVVGRSDTNLNRLLAAEQYQENVDEMLRIVVFYREWLENKSESLAAAKDTKKRVKLAIEEAELLELRLKAGV